MMRFLQNIGELKNIRLGVNAELLESFLVADCEDAVVESTFFWQMCLVLLVSVEWGSKLRMEPVSSILKIPKWGSSNCADRRTSHTTRLRLHVARPAYSVTGCWLAAGRHIDTDWLHVLWASVVVGKRGVLTGMIDHAACDYYATAHRHSAIIGAYRS